MNEEFREDKNQTFRAEYREKNIGKYYSGPAHFAFVSFLGVAGIIYCASRLHDVTPAQWLVIPITLLYANFVEYFLHKGPLHNNTKGMFIIYQRHTLLHHRFFGGGSMALESPRDLHIVLFPPVMIVGVGLIAFPLGLLFQKFVSPNAGLLFTASCIGAFLNYEWFHACYHAPPASVIWRLPGMKLLGRLHTRHHDPHLMTRYNFNITYPICDKIFRTYYS